MKCTSGLRGSPKVICVLPMQYDTAFSWSLWSPFKDSEVHCSEVWKSLLHFTFDSFSFFPGRFKPCKRCKTHSLSKMQSKRFHFPYESEGTNYEGTWITSGPWMVGEPGGFSCHRSSQKFHCRDVILRILAPHVISVRYILRLKDTMSSLILTCWAWK